MDPLFYDGANGKTPEAATSEVPFIYVKNIEDEAVSITVVIGTPHTRPIVAAVVSECRFVTVTGSWHENAVTTRTSELKAINAIECCPL